MREGREAPKKKKKKKFVRQQKMSYWGEYTYETTRADADFSRVQGGRQNEIHRANTYTLYIDRLIIQRALRAKFFYVFEALLFEVALVDLQHRHERLLGNLNLPERFHSFFTRGLLFEHFFFLEMSPP